MVAQPESVRALKRLERAARDAARALARESEQRVNDLEVRLAEMGIRLVRDDAQAKEGHSDER